MATRKRVGTRGPMGPPGPPGERGPTGPSGRRGAKGARGPNAVLAPDADARDLIKALDSQVDGIYKELTLQMNRMARIQSQLEDVRAAIRRLAAAPENL